MSFLAELTVGGAKMRLLHCSYSFQRDIDPTGRPSSEVRGGTMRFEIESTEKTGLFEWMVDGWTKKDGSIKFYKRDEKSAMKELQFKDAYIAEWSESIDAVGSNPMVENFVISAKEIKLGGGEHKNPWPI